MKSTRNPDNTATIPRARFRLNLYGLNSANEMVGIPTGYTEHTINVLDNGEAMRASPRSNATDVYKSLSMTSKRTRDDLLMMIGEIGLESDLFSESPEREFFMYVYPAGSRKKMPPNTIVGVDILPFYRSKHLACGLAITPKAEALRTYAGKDARTIHDSLNMMPMAAKKELMGLINRYGLEPLPGHI